MEGWFGPPAAQVKKNKAPVSLETGAFTWKGQVYWMAGAMATSITTRRSLRSTRGPGRFAATCLPIAWMNRC